jgi:phage/plasmid-associated DNA primase
MHFPYRFRRDGQELKLPTDKRGDANLRPRLRRGKRQHQAILAWLVEGAQAWYANGEQFPKPDPERITRDREEWRKSQDLIWRYMDEELEFDPEAHVMSADLFQEFTRWLGLQNQRPWGDKTFFDRFSNHQLTAEHNVIRRKIRKRSGLSNPTGKVVMSSLPASYWAWLGIRFKLPAVTFEL